MADPGDDLVDALLEEMDLNPPSASPSSSSPPPFIAAAIAGLSPERLAFLRSSVRGHDYSPNGECYVVKVVSLYDGDTGRFVYFDGDRSKQVVFRMAGYDSPEMKPPKSSPTRAAEIAAAHKARDALESKTSDLVVVRVGNLDGSPDKYGRLPVSMFTMDGTNLNEWMITSGHGVPYDGGTKKKFGSA